MTDKLSKNKQTNKQLVNYPNMSAASNFNDVIAAFLLILFCFCFCFNAHSWMRQWTKVTPMMSIIIWTVAQFLYQAMEMWLKCRLSVPHFQMLKNNWTEDLFHGSLIVSGQIKQMMIQSPNVHWNSQYEVQRDVDTHKINHLEQRCQTLVWLFGIEKVFQ